MCPTPRGLRQRSGGLHGAQPPPMGQENPRAPLEGLHSDIDRVVMGVPWRSQGRSQGWLERGHRGTGRGTGRVDSGSCALILETRSAPRSVTGLGSRGDCVPVGCQGAGHAQPGRGMLV